ARARPGPDARAPGAIAPMRTESLPNSGFRCRETGFPGRRKKPLTSPEPQINGLRDQDGRTKTPPNRGISHAFRKSPQLRECVVADAVPIEPVSTLNSLLTGKLTGNFVKIASLMRFCTLTRQQIQRLAAKFPTQQNREFLRRNREFWTAPEGVNRDFVC